MKRKNIISLFLLSAGCMLPLCASAQHVYSLDECIEAAAEVRKIGRIRRRAE